MFRPRTAAYTQAILALAFNVPFLLALLARYPRDLTWVSVAGAYAVMVFAGYYVLLLFLLLTAAWILTGAWRRVFLGTSVALISIALFYLAIDGIVYRAARSHIDAFWIQYLITTFEGIGIDVRQAASAGALFAAIVALELWLLRLSQRVIHRARWSAGLAAVSLLCFVVTQGIHIVAYNVNDTRFTHLTPQLPFYFPVTSQGNAAKYGGLISMVREVDADETGTGESLRYPLDDAGCRPDSARLRRNVLVLMLESWRADALDSVVSPQMYAFAQQSSLFLEHFSSGNSTRSGVVPLFYGIHPTYWTAIKANNARIHNPVLIDALEENGYAFGIFAKSHFKQHKIKDAVFRDIDVEESFPGATADVRDREMTERLFDFMARQQAARAPFFGFAFYKSTHYPYDYPADSAPFQPAAELAVLGLGAADDPLPALNDYRNAVRYTDGLIGNLLRRMRAAGMLENTIVVVTSDHGEQFNDARDNSWMHGGDFTRHLTRVPLIVYVPDEPPRRVSSVTSEVDIAPTILQKGLQCGWNAADYSNGLNLFGPLPERRPIVVASYVNHALIVGNDVFVTGPMFVERYDLDGNRAARVRPDVVMMQQALTEMTRFYGAPARSKATSLTQARDPHAPRPASAQ